MAVFTASFISFPILTRALAPADYGTMSVLSVTLWIFLAFSRAGLAESTVRFYGEYNGSGDPLLQSKYYSTLFIATLAFAAVTILFVVAFGDRMLELIFGRKLDGFYLILAGLILTGTMNARMLNFLRAQQRTKFYNMAMVSGRFLTVIVSLSALLIIAKTLQVYYLGLLAAEAAVSIILITLFLMERKISLEDFSPSVLKSFLSFGFPLIGFELGYLLLKSADRYVIQIMLGSEAVGIYSVASNMGHYTKDVILFPLMYALTPIYVEVWHTKGREATSKFVSEVANLTLLIIIPIFFITVLLGNDLIIALASAKYASAGGLLGWIVAGTLLWALLPIYAAGLYVEKKTKTISVAVLLCVVLDVILNIIGIHYFGLIGSCYAALASCGLLALYLTRISSNYLVIHLNLRTIAISLAGSLFMFGVMQLLPQAGNFLGVVLKLGACGLLYCSIVLLLHRDMRKMAFSAARQFKRFLSSALSR
jgi:O-antigen/teichoic acid export membrane protein